MVYKSIDHRKLLSILFLELKKKYERKWLYFLLRKRHVTSDVTLIIYTFMGNSYKPINTREF